jgi:hypothetical protein
MLGKKSAKGQVTKKTTGSRQSATVAAMIKLNAS